MKGLLLIIAFFVIAACGVEDFQPIISLNPPLDLFATNIYPGQIQVTFHGYNTEDYFSGYNIYIDNSPIYLGNPNPSNRVYQSGGSTNIPTLPETAMSGETVFTFIINNQDLPAGITSGQILTNIGFNYFINVRAYSIRYDFTSNPTSNFMVNMFQ